MRQALEPHVSPYFDWEKFQEYRDSLPEPKTPPPGDGEIVAALRAYQATHHDGRRAACRAVAHQLGVDIKRVDPFYTDLPLDLKGRPGPKIK
jgi:hypothetical protein